MLVQPLLLALPLELQFHEFAELLRFGERSHQSAAVIGCTPIPRR